MKQGKEVLAAALLAGLLAGCAGEPETPPEQRRSAGPDLPGVMDLVPEDLMEDGRYRAGRDGWLAGASGHPGRDLTQGARDMVRGTRDALEELDRDVMVYYGPV